MPARHHRVTRGDDYRRIVRTGNRVGGAYCITYVVPHSLEGTETTPVRFGYIISKAVGNAVTRNLVRRRMKSITDELIADGECCRDVVFRALPAAATCSYTELQREIRRSYAKLRVRT